MRFRAEDQEAVDEGETEDLEQLAVTAEELLENVTYIDPQTEVVKQYFKGMRSVNAYVEFYGKKLVEDYEYVMVEKRSEFLQVTMSQAEVELEKTVEEMAEKLCAAKIEGRKNPNA